MYCDVEVSVEVIFIGYFVVYCCQFWVIFQLFSDYCGVIEDVVDMFVLQIQFCVLVVVIWNGSDFWVFIYNEFLVCCFVLYVDFFVFQLINIGVFVLLIYKQGRVVIVWGGKQYLFFMFWSDIYVCYYGFYVMEFQVWDQVVKCLVRESVGCINFFIQCLCQVDVKINDLVVCIN